MTEQRWARSGGALRVGSASSYRGCDRDCIPADDAVDLADYPAAFRARGIFVAPENLKVA